MTIIKDIEYLKRRLVTLIRLLNENETISKETLSSLLLDVEDLEKKYKKEIKEKTIIEL